MWDIFCTKTSVEQIQVNIFAEVHNSMWVLFPQLFHEYFQMKAWIKIANQNPNQQHRWSTVSCWNYTLIIIAISVQARAEKLQTEVLKNTQLG